MSFDNTQPPPPPQGPAVPPPAGPPTPPPAMTGPFVPTPQYPPTPTQQYTAPGYMPAAGPGLAPPPVGGDAAEGSKSFVATWLLAWLVGFLGIDRFYLGKVGTGLLKLVTLGGVGVWWLIDLILVLSGAARDKRGFALAGYREHRKIAWIVTGAGIVLGMIINGVNAGNAASNAPAAVAELEDEPAVEGEAADAQEPAATEPTEEPALAVVPDMIGSLVRESRQIAEDDGLRFTAPAEATDDSVIATQSIAPGDEVEAGTEIVVTVEPPEPELTLEQENALGQAQNYLDLMGFSRDGLVGQLEFEGYSTEVASFAADNAGADWNAEAAEKAQNYLDSMSFSRSGLYDQLAFEKFTPEQIEFALAAVGY